VRIKNKMIVITKMVMMMTSKSQVKIQNKILPKKTSNQQLHLKKEVLLWKKLSIEASKNLNKPRKLRLDCLRKRNQNFKMISIETHRG